MPALVALELFATKLAQAIFTPDATPSPMLAKQA
jgi:hypothetical protein